jgi:hypothetical protein
MRNHGTVQGVFWIAEGILFRDDIALPSPPPPSVVFAVAPPMNWVGRESPTLDASPLDIQNAEFRLADGWKASHERVHYNLATGAPRGWRWIVVGKEIRAVRDAFPPPPSPLGSARTFGLHLPHSAHPQRGTMTDETRRGETFRLCYIAEPWAYFTTRPVEEQWGDDWDDAPYEHNAGRPYEWRVESDGQWCRCVDPKGVFCRHGDGACGKPGHLPKPPVARWEVMRIAWEGPFDTPAGRASGGSSSYSVRDINAGQIAWLLPSRDAAPHRVHIPAGTSLDDFARLVRSVGGTIYTPHPPDPPAVPSEPTPHV